MTHMEKARDYAAQARMCNRTYLRLRAADAPQFARAARDARASNMGMARYWAGRAAAMRGVTV